MFSLMLTVLYGVQPPHFPYLHFKGTEEYTDSLWAFHRACEWAAKCIDCNYVSVRIFD